jgi:hypothetical protein
VTKKRNRNLEPTLQAEEDVFERVSLIYEGGAWYCRQTIAELTNGSWRPLLPGWNVTDVFASIC